MLSQKIAKFYDVLIGNCVTLGILGKFPTVAKRSSQVVADSQSLQYFRLPATIVEMTDDRNPTNLKMGAELPHKREHCVDGQFKAGKPEAWETEEKNCKTRSITKNEK